MKKLFTVLTVLLPLAYVLGMIVFLYISPEDEVLFAVLGGITLLGLVICTVFSVITSKADRKFLAVTDIWILAVNLVLYVAEAVWWLVAYVQVRIGEQNGAMEGGLALVLLIFFYTPHWITYLFSRICASINCERVLKDVCGNGVKTFHIILHFFPFTDLISAIWVLRRVNQFQHCQQPPIEME